MTSIVSPLPQIRAAFVCWVSVMWIGHAAAQNAANGKAIYTAVLVAGQKSCSTGTCHGPDPATNQNAIKNGANASAITAAITSVPDMRFLAGAISATRLADLAAYIANPRAANSSPVASVSTTTLGFGSVNIGSPSAAQSITLTNTGAATLQLSAITLSSSEFVSTGGSCTPATTLLVAASCTVSVSFQPATAGVRAGTLSVTHNAPGGASVVSLAGTGTAPSTGAATADMIEYYLPSLDYYFITSHVDDINTLDKMAAWQRTGKSFKAYVEQQPNTLGINRYFFDRVAVNQSRGSHFYTLVQAEKDALEAFNPINSSAPRLPYNEGVDAYAFAPVVEGVGGSCAPSQTPVFRIFRGPARFPDNGNHRFTTDTAVYNSFVASGWDDEGVKFCAPN
jgi:Repeat of unknown function (DUF5648)